MPGLVTTSTVAGPAVLPLRVTMRVAKPPSSVTLALAALISTVLAGTFVTTRHGESSEVWPTPRFGTVAVAVAVMKPIPGYAKDVWIAASPFASVVTSIAGCHCCPSPKPLGSQALLE